MNLSERKILLFIKFMPLFVIIVIYIICSLFLYKNNYELFEKYFKEVILLSIILILISLYLSYKITNLLKKSFVKYQNKILEDIEENKKRDFMLFQQSKLATIGELLYNISHQWRQPLSVITTTASGIKIQKEMGIDNKLKEIEMLDGIVKNANYLSQTIEDFRDFYNPTTLKVDFLIGDCINKCLKIINPQFMNKDIIIKQDIEEFSIYGFEQQLIQVLINLLNNSRDIFETNNIKNKIIFIKTRIIKDNFIIEITDSGGGIEKSNLEKIFEPYFTTKHKSAGTGVSLYMSYQIISENFNGHLTVENSEIKYLNKEYFGARFKIIIPFKS